MATVFNPSQAFGAPSGADIFFHGEPRTIATAILHDRHGNLIVTGYRFASDISGTGGAGGFISKHKSSGRLIQTLDLRGTAFNDIEYAALDSHDQLWVLGSTSSNTPPVGGSAQRENHGNMEMYIARLSDDGSSLVLRSYLGGSDYDWAAGMAIDQKDNIIIGGSTLSSDFPTTPDALRREHSGPNYTDLFLSKLSPGASNVVYSTLIGGDEWDDASAFYLAQDGAAYLAGTTASADFPFTKSPDNRYEVPMPFLCKLSASNTLAFARQIGIPGGDTTIEAIATVGQNNIVLAGRSVAPACPAQETSHIGFPESGMPNGLLAKLDASGTVLWSRSIGGSGDNRCSALLGTHSGELVAALNLDGLLAIAKFDSTGDPLQIEPVSDRSSFWVTRLSEGNSGVICVSGVYFTNWPANVSYYNQLRVAHGFAAQVNFPNKPKSPAPHFVHLSSPQPEQAFSVNESIEVIADVFTIDAPVEAVRVFAGGTLAGVKLEPPYNFTYSNSVPGLQTVYAVALDRAGNSFTSAPVSFQIVSRPANDEASSAIRLTGGSWSVSGSNLGAASLAQEEELVYPINPRSIWWSWTAPESGPYAIDSVGSEIPVELLILNGFNFKQSDIVAIATHFYTQLVTRAVFKAAAGTTYYIAAAGNDGSQGRIQLNLNPAHPPPNDDRDNATPLGPFLGIVQGNDREASLEAFETVGLPFGRSVWWVWTAPESGTYRISLPAALMDGQIGLFDGNSWWPFGPFASGGLGYDLVFYATEGENYYLRLFRGYSDEGEVSFEIGRVPPPANDDFDAAFRVEGNSWVIEGSTAGATIEPGENLQFSARSVWWNWHAPKTGQFLLRVLNASAYPAVYTGTSISNLLGVTPQDLREFVTFSAVAETDYRIAVVSPLDTPFKMELREITLPANDDFANRTLLSGALFKTNGSCAGATSVPTDPGYGPFFYMFPPTVWYRWIAPSDGVFHMDFQPAVICAVLTGTNEATLEQVARTSGGSPLVFHARAGEEYEIMVADSGFSFTLSLRPAIPPSNDDFVNADLLPESGADLKCAGDATQEPGEPPAYAGTVWWRWIPSVSGRYVASLGSYPYSQSAEFYEGDSLASLQPVVLNGVTPTNGLPMADLVAGREYRIRVITSINGVSLRVFKVTSPANDNFADRIVVFGDSLLLSGSSEYATVEPGEPGIATPGSVWWSWTAPRSAQTEISRLSHYPIIDVFTGDSLANLTAVTSPFGSTFFARAGEMYAIRVSDSFNYGDFRVLVQQDSPPRIQSLTLANGYFKLQFSVNANQSAVTETSSNLVQWVPIATNSIPPVFIPLINHGAILPAQFFRVRVQ